MSGMPQQPDATSSAEPASSPPRSAETRRWHHRRGDEGRSAFLPLLIFFIAAVAWSGFQFQQLRLERETLTTLRGTQEAQFQQAQKVRATLDSMAVETQRLADSGNANARLVVDELRKRGITINRPSPDAKK